MGMNPQLMQMMQAMQGGGQQPQQGQAQQPPANIPPEALMTILTYLAQSGGGKQGQPAPTNAQQLQNPQQLQQIMPALMQMLGQQQPPPQQQQMQAQQQGQQKQQQAQQQQQQVPQQLMQLLAGMGLKVG